jgi:hypothetical protein
MAVGLPAKVSYANGDVFSASDINDTNGTINLIGQTNNFYAGKNKIINGDFRFNQRAFTSNTASGIYNFDRFLQFNSGTTGTLTITPQVFTAGTAPVSGYEATNFVQCITAAGLSTDTNALIVQRIEDVRTLANQATTISFWAKAASGTPKIAVELEQNFGTGGSPSATVQTPVGAVTISTSWARYSVSITVPSLSGKTVGTTANTSYLAINIWLSAGSTYATRASSIGLQNATFQIWGVQVESGSTATAFSTSTGNVATELVACQRYFYRWNSGELGTAAYYSAAGLFPSLNFPVEMRTAPTSATISSASAITVYVNGVGRATTALAYNSASTRSLSLSLTTSAATAGQAGQMTLSGTIDASAEL